MHKLQGTWVRVRAQNDQTERSAKIFNSPIPVVTWTFAGDHITHLERSAESKNRHKLRFTLDVQAKPMRLIFLFPQPIFGKDQIQTICRLEGDVLTVCGAPSAKDELPSAFPGPDDKRCILFVFNRKKR